MGEFDQNKSKFIEEHINYNIFINCNWRGRGLTEMNVYTDEFTKQLLSSGFFFNLDHTCLTIVYAPYLSFY